ncbi:hypothetical protein RRG08_054206 [Elysia crispata]|uniref:Uncharacterized protein n=1 Tax=Elysia crispata TaxID=231223 RepID=A0AAE0YBQ5_9GAST|nr:hypothetical protein RRG08_054206 [Elysia crispata]
MFMYAEKLKPHPFLFDSMHSWQSSGSLNPDWSEFEHLNQNRPRAFTEDHVQQIVDHIRSFRGRQSHYSVTDTRRLYLSEELAIRKMHDLYLQQHPNAACYCESYSFGYPSKDTCSTCDALKVQLVSSDAKAEQLQKLNVERELNLCKGRNPVIRPGIEPGTQWSVQALLIELLVD